MNITFYKLNLLLIEAPAIINLHLHYFKGNTMASSSNTYIVLLLDGRQYTCKLNNKTPTEELFDCVISYLGIQEREYFGLCFISEPGKYREWIALEKRLVS